MLNVPEAIKTAYRSDVAYKNFRVHFPNGERPDITNENIVSESVRFNESICSEPTLKFGLCETPTIQFETVGIEKIKGLIIECSIEIECPSTIEGAVYKNDIQKYVYSIPYGTFKIDSCKRQKDMSHRQIMAYQQTALDNWSFPAELKNSLGLFNWYLPNDINIAIEVFFKLMGLYPKTFQSLVAGPESESTAVTLYNMIIDGVPHDVKISITYDTYTFDDRYADSLEILKTNYEQSYISKVKEMYDYLSSFDILTGSVAEILKDLNGSDIRRTYSLIYSDNNGTGYLHETIGGYRDSLFFPSNKEYVTAQIYKTEQTSDDVAWVLRVGGYQAAYSGFIPDTWFMPVRIKASYTENNNEVIVFDTGRFNNTLLRDSNNVPFSHSDLDMYYRLSSQANKKSFEYVRINSTTTTVQKTVYKNNASQLESLDVLSFIEGALEVKGMFGKFNRDGSFSMLSLLAAPVYDMP